MTLNPKEVVVQEVFTLDVLWTEKKGLVGAKRDVEILEQVRQGAAELIKALEYLSHQKRLRELSLFSLKM